MNEMNWNRHINACQIRKAKRKHHNITSFFTASQTKKKCSTITAKSGRKYSIFIFIIRARNLVHFILPYYDVGTSLYKFDSWNMKSSGIIFILNFLHFR